MNLLPEKYRNLNDSELKTRISELKKKWGNELCILGHYYQREDVIEFADHEGDSFALAEAGSKTKAKYIVFCGVHFMAEASVILAREGQRVFLPDMAAGCPLADMANIDDVEDAWRALENAGVAKDFLPVVYMNSSSELKAFCGKRGGLVCTSSSAVRAFKWVFAQGKKILFFPDKNLGINTARALGIKDEEIFLWKYSDTSGVAPLAGRQFVTVAQAKARYSKLILWNGYCHVHTFFTTKHIEDARAKYPDCKIIVHPECDPSVVERSDGNGSTAYLKKYAEDAPDGSTIVIGTEINLVSRLAKKFKTKKIVPLARSLCPNMFKISPEDLLQTLENLGKLNEIFVANEVALDAKVALNRMLTL